MQDDDLKENYKRNKLIASLMQRALLVRLSTLISLGLNLLLMLFKLTVGFIFNSISLISDGLDTLLDLLTASFATIGYKMSQKPPDSEHPFGYEKYQFIFSLGISGVMFLSAFSIGQEAIKRLINHVVLSPNWLILVTALVSILGKTILGIVLMHIGKKVESHVIVSNAKNYLTDAFSSFFVVIAFIGSYYDLWWFDPVCAFIIVGLILYTGTDIIKTSVPKLLDRAPPKEVVEELEHIAMSNQQVKEVHIVRLRELDKCYTGDFHLLVNPELTIEAAHDVAEDIKEQLEKTGKFKRLVIHLEPYTSKESLKHNEMEKPPKANSKN